ncbi:MAG: phosphoribosylamine--glycine ligase [Planctomycetota bacterium]
MAGSNQSQQQHHTPSGMPEHDRRRRCPDKTNVLLIGGGGREHALAYRLSQSPRLRTLWVTNGENPALAGLGRVCPVRLDYKEIWRLQEWCDKQRIDLVVVGPEEPLAQGITDALATDRRLVFGVSKAAAQLEADKAWAKQLMRSAAIPTAEGREFNNFERALHYLQHRDDPPVIKAAGLAAGKGVLLPNSMSEAEEALTRLMKHREFGVAGDRVIIEERLQGPEVSVLALVDGRNVYVLEPCQDHKRLQEGDQGPNTGGMGAYCPVPILNDSMMTRIEREIFVPTLDALRREEIDYRGVLYAGVMLTPAGPKVLEFNCRFGDPETQPLMARIWGDVLELLWATAAGRLDEVQIDWDPRPACCVVMVSGGYPGPYEKDMPISGIDEATADPDVLVFHAGTRAGDEKHPFVTGGGRVLGVTGLGDTMRDARDRAISACEKIRFNRAFFRTDIAWQAINGTAGKTRSR